MYINFNLTLPGQWHSTQMENPIVPVIIYSYVVRISTSAHTEQKQNFNSMISQLNTLFYSYGHLFDQESFRVLWHIWSGSVMLCLTECVWVRRMWSYVKRSVLWSGVTCMTLVRETSIAIRSLFNLKVKSITATWIKLNGCAHEQALQSKDQVYLTNLLQRRPFIDQCLLYKNM